jgi:MFS family permease
VTGGDLVTVFLRWNWWRAVLHRGWWLVTSVYLVVDAGLTPSELVLIGVAQGVISIVFEVPAGVVADLISRKWSLVVSHVLMGTAMIATGLVTGFGSLVATQMLWGLSWTFASGADVAWITDELNEPMHTSVVLMRSGRAQLTGSAAGMAGVGALASLTQRSTAMVLAGAAMLLLGLFIAARFREERFVPSPTRGWSISWSILVRGSTLVRGNRAILLMVAATFLVNGAGIFGRLYPRRLVDIGLPSNPVVWFTVLGVLALLMGAVALRAIEPHIDGVRTAQRGYVFACAVGAIGVIGLVGAPEKVSGSVAVLFVAGIAVPLTRVFGTIWVNRQTTADVRATVHSFLAQAEYAGVIVWGLAVSLVAGLAGLSLALATCGALFVITIVVIRRFSTSRAAQASADTLSE